MITKRDISKKAKEFFNKYKYLLLVVAAGILLLLLPTGGGNTSSPQAPDDVYETFDLADTERQLAAILGKIDGVGRVEVALTLKETMRTRYTADRRGETVETVIVQTGSGVQEPVVETREYPVYRGALIVCEGGGNPAVRLEVTDAVSALLGLSYDKIIVSAMTH